MKKRNALFAFGATALMLLSSCDRITAYPTNANEPLTDTKIILDHNTLDTIYDAIRTSSSYSSDVKNLLAVSIAEKVLGKFEVQPDSSSDYGFKIALVDYDGKSSTEQSSFISSHSAYKNWKHTAFKLSMDDATPSTAQFEARLAIIKNIIEEKIVTALWDEANTASYKRNNRFYEVLFARDIYKKLYTIVDATGAEVDAETVLYENPTYQKHYTYYGAEELFNGLIDNGVWVNKGTMYDSSCEGYIRINVACGRKQLLDGLKCIENFIDSLK